MVIKIRRKTFRQKIKEKDEFVSFSQRTITYIMENSRAVILITMLAVTIIISTGFFIKWSIAQKGMFFNNMYDEIMLANNYFNNDQLENAAKLFKDFIEKNDKSSLFNEIGQVGLGYTLMESKDYDKAAKIFEELIAKEDFQYPKEDIYKNLAILYEKTGKHNKAIEIYRKMVALYPQSTDIAIYMDKA